MKDSQEYLLIKSLELRHSPWIFEADNPNKLQDGIHRSFNLIFNTYLDRISILIHFKHLNIENMELYYRKRSANNRKIKKVYPQRKMKLYFNNTLELLSYLSGNNYKVDWFQIRFTNGWVIKNHFINGLEFITNNTIERNLLLEKIITVSGQGPIDINSLEINETYTLCTNGELKQKPFLL
jgi:hypothetical protein